MAEDIVSPAVPEKHREDKLAQVRDGMEVYDRLDKRVGKVDGVYSGADDSQPNTPTVLPVAVPVPTQVPLVQPVTRGEHVPEFDEVLDPTLEIPKEVRERLKHDGFVRVDAGFLHHHRYVLRDQVERVEGERVILNAVADDVLKY